MDERLRLSSAASKNIYAIQQLYRLSADSSQISISRFHQALHAVIMKHSILRTALYLHTDGTIVQRSVDTNISSTTDRSHPYGFSILNLHNDHRHIDVIIKEILNHSNLFDLSRGRVVHCHILRHSDVGDDVITSGDIITMHIHHAAFDGMSTTTFLSDLLSAYENSGSLHVDENTLQYIDYSIHEHVMDTSASRDFWHAHLDGCNFQHQLSLPMDKQRSSTNQRSNLVSVVHILFNNDATEAFLHYASSHHLTAFQLGLALFYVFLFKLTHGENDLCIASINANRYRSEISNMIGMFVSTLPNRIQMDSDWSFDQLVTHVRQMCISILEHSHYPLQRIFADFHLNQSNASFLETIFDVVTIAGKTQRFSMDGVQFHGFSIRNSHQMGKFDFKVTFCVNLTADADRLTCKIEGSRDLFETTTISQIAQRFQHLFDQVFGLLPRVSSTGGLDASIEKLSIILPSEENEMGDGIFSRQKDVVNEGTLMR